MFTAALVFALMFGGMAYGAFAIARRSVTVIAVLFKWAAICLSFLTGCFVLAVIISALKSPVALALLFFCAAAFIIWRIAEQRKHSAIRRQEAAMAPQYGEPYPPVNTNYLPPPPVQDYGAPQYREPNSGPEGQWPTGGFR